jgi:hypothetical protein
MTSRSITAPLVLTAALSAASIAHANVVTAWNSAALDAIRANRTSPPRASRALAILHASIYDAINGITRSHESYFVRSDVPASASIEAAASGRRACCPRCPVPRGGDALRRPPRCDHGHDLDRSAQMERTPGERVWRATFWPGARATVPTLSLIRLQALALVSGTQLHLRSRHISCPSGHLSCRLRCLRAPSCVRPDRRHSTVQSGLPTTTK